MIALALALNGCAMGPAPETLVYELRVLAIPLSPPEIGPGEAALVAPVIADPLAAGFEVALWTCALTGDPTADAAACLETAAREPADWGQVIAPGESADLYAEAALAGVLSDELPELPASVWTLACEPGLCPIIQDLADPPAAGSAAAQALADQLASPWDMLEDLPLTGVSLARTSLVVSNRDPADRRAAPALSLAEPLEPVAPGGSQVLRFEVAGEGSLVAYGFSSDGGFSAVSAEPAGGIVEMEWFAPEDAGSVDLWVALQDGAGGSSAWQGEITVE